MTIDIRELFRPESDLAHRRYMAIDDGIRANISEHEFNWMGDTEKALLEQRETEPDV